MKRFAYTLFCMAAFTTSAMAQANSDTLRVVESNVSRVGEDVIVDMKLDLSHIEVGRNRTLVYRPLLMKEDSVAELTPIIVNGRVRHIQYQRLERAEDFPNEIEIRRENGTEQTLDYHARVPFTDWMNKSEVVMVCDLCGCGWESLQNDRSSLFPVNLIHEPVVPAVLYITPLAEVKVREKSGSAYLDFPVNQTVIRPDYRRNSTELAAIDATIQSVEDDPNATITKVTIKGYASPEGSYANNQRLAEGRSNALLEYVKKLHDFGDAEFSVSSEPEDWEGLEKRIESSSIADKEEWLAIIRDSEPADLDRKEWKLKQLPTYREVLNTIYPALRHSDYTVEYHIRNFTTDEAREMLYKDPSQLSLEEMYRVAQTYEVGSESYNEVFEIAVRLYPDDPISNLNAANTALLNRNATAARRYLTKAAEGPEKRLAEGVASWLEGDTDQARSIFESLTDDPKVGVQAKENLEKMD
ncbi:MAG TPA: DUF3868 domain-containing protein [Candidatus Parabacteroides intestinavium]|nr:DUF3868 domain-containing protein [Candidatus Parabacteroides intestinavium]